MVFEEINLKKINYLKNRFLGERIFIIGNGPSLNQLNLSLFKDEYTFAVNRFYLMYDKINWRPTFYTANDTRVVPDNQKEINFLNGSIFFFDEKFKDILRDDNDVCWYKHNSSQDSKIDKIFSNNILNGIRGAGSVIGSAIQLSVHMGFKELILIGCDLNYIVNDTVKQEGIDKFGNGVKINLTSTIDDDPNHFDPSYFGRGKKWHDPNVNRMIEGHKQCLEGCNFYNVKILNATKGGNLNIYPRISYDKLNFKTKKNYQLISNFFDLSNQLEKRKVKSLEYEQNDFKQINESTVLFNIAKDLFDLKSELILDIGAHHGNASIQFLEKGCDVIAFEPDKKNYNIFLDSVKSLKLEKNLILENKAISDENKFTKIYTSSISSGISSLDKFHNSHAESDYEIEVVRLDDYLKEKKAKIIKIDCEGHDLKVLKSLNWKSKPELILCEYDFKKKNHNPFDLINFLLEKDFIIYISEWYPITEYGSKHSWRRLNKFPCDIDINSWGNLLAISRKFEKIDINKYFYHSLENKKLKIFRIERLINNFKNIKFLIWALNYFKWFISFIKRKKKLLFFTFIITIALFALNFFILKYLLLYILIILFYLTFFLISVAGFISKNVIGVIKSQLQSLKQQLSTLEQQSEKSNKFEENISGEVQQYQSQLQSLKQQLSTLEQSERSNKAINGSYGHNRIINSDEIFKNLELLNKQVGLNLNRKLKYIYIAEKFLQLEKNLTGRFASSIENLLFRFILYSSLKKDKINILEIGTLFGISIQLIIKELKLNNVEAFVDIIDSLNGFYNKHTDPITEYNVSVDIFNENMKMNGINQKKINLITMYSTEGRINFKFNPYDIIFVDGDHSYLGVENDFNLSNSNLNKNGILVFDDYKNNNWPGVTEFVDKKVLTNDKFIKIFDAFNLIAFKKIH